MKTISISMGNTKMGPIPSFSLMPIVTCNKDSPCAKCKNKCYAWKMARRRKTISRSWEKNTYIATQHLDVFKRQMNGWLSIYQPVAFRIHVGGDFFSDEYFLAWCDIAKDNPNVKFFAFTKQWDVLRNCVKTIPKNLSIILSAWMPDYNNWCPPLDLMRKFPVAWIERRSTADRYAIAEVMTHLKRNANRCDGNCAECGMCFNRKKKDGDILFWYH